MQRDSSGSEGGAGGEDQAGDGPQGPSNATQRAAEAASPLEPPRDAIVFIPGLLSGATEGKTVGGVVTRLQAAADQESRTGDARFEVRYHEGAIDGPPGPKPRLRKVATIVRRHGKEEKPAFDILEFSWPGGLSSAWEAQSSLRRMIRGLFALTNVSSFWRFFSTGGKRSPKGKLQLLVASVIILVAVAYVILMLIAGIESVTQIPTLLGDNATGEPETSTDAAISGVQWLAIISTLSLPLLRRPREQLSLLGAVLFASQSYVRLGEQRDNIIGHLASGLERLRDDRTYSRVRVIAYSFGAVVALDALFPRSEPPERSFEIVDSLVTIGLPYELVEALERDYWEGRCASTEGQLTWINVFARIDLMGSDLRRNVKGKAKQETKQVESQKVGKGDDGIVVPLGINNPRDEAGELEGTPQYTPEPANNVEYNLGIQVSGRNIMEMYGFISHGMYWGMDDAVDRNVFRGIITRLYGDEPGGLLA